MCQRKEYYLLGKCECQPYDAESIQANMSPWLQTNPLHRGKYTMGLHESTDQTAVNVKKSASGILLQQHICHIIQPKVQGTMLWRHNAPQTCRHTHWTVVNVKMSPVWLFSIAIICCLNGCRHSQIIYYVCVMPLTTNVLVKRMRRAAQYFTVSLMCTAGCLRRWWQGDGLLPHGPGSPQLLTVKRAAIRE